MPMIELLPPVRESAQQTAARLRRALRGRWPGQRFTVRLAANAALHVHWTDGPSVEQLSQMAHGYARELDGEHQTEPTLWVSPRGLLSMVYPGVEQIVLERSSAGAIAQHVA